jgi:hypothetical protein
MKIVRLSLSIDDPDRLEVQMLEFIQTARFVSCGVKTLPAKFPVPFLD